jgi:hypothetical protein
VRYQVASGIFGHRALGRYGSPKVSQQGESGVFPAGGQDVRYHVARGAVAARAMVEGGIAFFVLDMFAQPNDAHSTMLLDPGQYVALACAVVGAGLWALVTQPVRDERSEMKRQEVVDAQ